MSEVISLDEHRLLCGNAQVKEDVDKLLDGVKVDLLLTDPPYGIDIVKVIGERESNGTLAGHKIKPSKPFKARNSGHRSKTRIPQEREREQMVKLESPGVVQPRLYKPVIGDDKPFDPQHLLDLDVPTILFGANNFSSKLPDMSKWIVWHKKPSLDAPPNGFSDCELAWTNFKGKAVLCYHHTWSGMVRQGERKLELKERVHPTQKPVGLLKRLIEEYCPPNGVVLDLYGGSGSTLIACAETGRTCYMMELSKDYVEIIQERYWNYRDKEQRRLI